MATEFDSSKANEFVRKASSDLGAELWLAIEWSLLPNLAIPRITKPFVGTGKYLNQGASRQSAAMQVVKTLFRSGLQPAHVEMLAGIRCVHERHGVTVDDIGYTLSGLATGIPEWFSRFSSQTISPEQESALVVFVNLLANASGFQRLGHAADSTAWREFQTEYEAMYRGRSAENRTMYLNMMQVFVKRFPPNWRLVSKLFFSCSTPRELFEYIDVRPPRLCSRLLFASLVHTRRTLGARSSINRHVDQLATAE